MARKPVGPILDAAPGLRQRLRANGTWRLWWEPTADQKAAGAKVVEFDAAKPAHATREATKLHDKWGKVARGETPVAQQTGRTINGLVQDYLQSLAWSKKPASTQRVYKSDMKAIAEKWGTDPVVLFDKPMIATWYEAMHKARGVTRSRAILRMFSILMEHAELRGWRAEGSNPCRNIRTESPLERERSADWAEFDALIAAARRLRSRSVLMALYLAVSAGQRQYDILRVKPCDFYYVDDPLRLRPVWVWQLVQSKRKRELEVPMHTMAVPTLRMQLLRAQTQGPGTLIWDEVTGKAFTPERFFLAWDKVRTEAAKALPSLESLQWRDLRRSFSNLSRAGGSSVSDTSDVLGNTAAKNPKLRRTYMAPQLATTLRAVDAIQRPQPQAKPPERKKA